MVFNSPFMEEDRHGILYCNGVNIFESSFDGGMGILNLDSSAFQR